MSQPDPTRYTNEHEAKIRVVVNAFADDCSDMTREDAEDMAQEARMAVWRWLVANPTQSLGPGLVRLLTIQACRDFERDSRLQREIESLPPRYDRAVEPEQEYIVRLGDLLAKIVNDEREAAVALFVIYEGLTVRETAEEMGLPRSSVQDILNRLRVRAVELGVIG